MAKQDKNTAPETVEAAPASVTNPEAEDTGEDNGVRVGPMHNAFAEYLNENFAADITPEQIFLVTSKRKAFRSTEAYRVGVRQAQDEARAQEEADKETRRQEREAERAAKAEERAKEKAAKAEEKAKADAEKAEAKAQADAEKAAKAEAKAQADAEKAAKEPVVTKPAVPEPAAAASTENGEATTKTRTKAKGKTPAAF